MRSITNRTSFTAQKQDSADKWILGVAFILGIVGSLALKVMGLPVWAPAVFAGGVIILYAILAHIIPTMQLESDQVGDNAYYLGFVLTLTSLSFTLYELGQHSGDADFIAYVIAGFGVALSSTIVGVSVRVICLQFRLDLVARDREARIALNDAMRQFRAELTDVIRGTKYLGVEIRQSLLEYHEELAKAHREATKNLNGELISAFRAALDPLNGQLTSLTQQALDDAKATVSSSAAARDAVFKSTSDGLAFATQSISSDMQELSSVISKILKNALSDLEEAKISIAALAEEATKSVGKQQAAAENLLTEVGKAAASVVHGTSREASASMSALTEQAARNLETQKAAAEQLLMEIAKLAVRSVDGASQSAAEIVSANAAKTKEELDTSSAASMASLEAIRKSTETLVSELQNHLATVSEFTFAMQKADAQATSASNDILQQIKASSASLAESQKLQLQVLEKILEQHRSLSPIAATPVVAAQ